MMRIDICLPSGKRKHLEIPESSNVGYLKVLAQKSFGRGFLKLVAAQGRILLDPQESVQAAGIQDGDTLTAIAQTAKIAAAPQAFALWCVGGDRIVTWGNPDRGGDSSHVQEQLRNVQQIQSTRSAFAAIL